MKREEETTHPCYKPVRKTKKHIAEEAKRFSFLYPSESKEMFFIYGAEWAEKIMLDRAENYLRSKLEYRPILKEEYIHGEDYIRHRQEQSRLCDEFITAFRQAMEGGAE